jgi:hypothetical protein
VSFNSCSCSSLRIQLALYVAADDETNAKKIRKEA